MAFYPSLRYTDARAAIDWLEQAFGFEPKAVHDNPDGSVGHAELVFGDGMIMFGSEPPGGDDRFGVRAGLGWSYVTVDADAIDALHDRAVAAGAEVVMELTDLDYGSRDFSARDPEGNLWSFGTYRPPA